MGLVVLENFLIRLGDPFEDPGAALFLGEQSRRKRILEFALAILRIVVADLAALIDEEDIRVEPLRSQDLLELANDVNVFELFPIDHNFRPLQL